MTTRRTRTVRSVTALVAIVAALALTWNTYARSQPDAARAAIAPARPTAAIDGPWRVVRVTDGDTISVARTGSGGAVTVRLLGIDSPETVDPRKPVQCYGREASASLKQLLAGRTVDLEHGPEATDKYGRVLAYVWIGDELVNYRQVLDGYAREYTYGARPAQHAAAIRAAQAEARTAGRGLWAPAGCNGTTEGPR
ncbi:thermonuclease family protein [Tsukamurella ocularis]|uniref:thermonuclease family protein n=1 Tax=Tsukamurella ocularis TaxID=1970234 RepID=UPI002168705C|nr:thermonuclease family protein [Tsukamurella ocularis]MCS3779366.1 micrococcal nuclease [Tsukamurella ocularis]MCS3789904.1 micrococcal nuclease [Tsukamurella ocularis]